MRRYGNVRWCPGAESTHSAYGPWFDSQNATSDCISSGQNLTTNARLARWQQLESTQTGPSARRLFDLVQRTALLYVL